MSKIISLILLLPQLASANLPEAYQSWAACEKQEYLFNEKIVPSAYKHIPSYTSGGFYALFGSGALFNLDLSFNHASDEMPKGRLKIIHTFGSVAMVDFMPSEDSPYTGLFQGACGLVRLGWAAPPLISGHTPGMAIKLFIDAKPSANMHVMHSLDGQGRNTNFFENTFTNIIPKPENLLLRSLEKIFERFVTNARHLKVEHVALYDSYGNLSDNVKAPYQIYFVPVETVQLDQNSKVDLRLALESIPSGNVLYEIFARDAADTEAQKIGELKLKSAFVASKWGDEKLFFQHADDFLREEFQD